MAEKYVEGPEAVVPTRFGRVLRRLGGVFGGAADRVDERWGRRERVILKLRPFDKRLLRRMPRG